MPRSATIAPRLGPDAHNGSVAIWRDGYKAAMVRVETCLLAGDVTGIGAAVNEALTSDGRGKNRKRGPDAVK
jgi:hypothetical protein